MFSRKPLKQLFVFVHLPKCAGTSLLKTFSHVGRRRFGVVAENDLKSQAMNSLKQQMDEFKIAPPKLDLIMGRDTFFGIQHVSPREPYFFTFIRNPIERFVSQYRYYVDCATNPNHFAHAMAVKRLDDDGKQLNLREFAESGRGDNFICKVLGSISPSRVNHDYFWNVNEEEALPAAIETLGKMKFIGFVEQIEEDTNNICAKLKIKSVLKRINRSFAKIEVDDSTRKLIERNNALDMEVFEEAKKLRRELDTAR